MYIRAAGIAGVRLMSLAMGVAALAILPAAAGAAPAMPHIPAAVSRVTAKSSPLGKVRYIDHGLGVQPPKKKRVKGKKNMPLFNAYGLHTAAAQRASIGFKDGSVLQMDQRTDAVLRSPSVTYVRSGEVEQIVIPGTKHQVKTNDAVAAAIGTIFDVKVTKAGTVITVLSGIVKVTATKGSVQVGPNQQTTVAPGQAPTPPAPANASAAVTWSQGIPAPTGNLVVNGDAEQGTGAANDTTQLPVPGWTATGGFTAAQYGQDNFPSLTDFGPVDRGKNLFAGGPNAAVSTGTQTVDVSKFAAGIDAGGWTMYASAYLGGYLTQADSATLTATAQSASHQALATLTLGPTTESQRGGATGLIEWHGYVHVPPKTRFIRLVLTMTRGGAGTYNHGYADDVALLLTSP